MSDGRAGSPQLSAVDIEKLVHAATAAQAKAYAPYSNFPVGAALLAAGGAVYTGCNVEIAVYGLGVCAERNAVYHAVAQGAHEFVAIAVVTRNGVTPCGACRQVLAEFAPHLTVIIVDADGNRQVYSLDELLPHAFGPQHLATT